MKSYYFSRLPKSFCKEKASLRFAKLEKRKTGQNLGKTEQQLVNNFFGVLLQLKSKNSEQTPESQLYRAYCQNNLDQKDDLVIFKDFCNEANRICFLDSMSKLLIHLPPEAKTWHKASK